MNRTGGAVEGLGGSCDGGLEGMNRESVEKFVSEYKWCLGGT